MFDRVAYDRAYFQRNKARRGRQVEARRQKLVAYVRSAKDAPCTDCGGRFHPAAMQFDHLGDKDRSLADATSRGWSQERIEAEIAKCELVCANCHAVRTYSRIQSGSSALVA